jgi:flagellar hook-associated protein 2
VEGVTFTLVGKGETTISVNTDAEAVQENVVEFIEAINSFRATINQLTKYDKNKTTYDVTDAESLYEMQKGSILTGNYGVQLLSSQ